MPYSQVIPRNSLLVRLVSMFFPPLVELITRKLFLHRSNFFFPIFTAPKAPHIKCQFRERLICLGGERFNARTPHTQTFPFVPFLDRSASHFVVAIHDTQMSNFQGGISDEVFFRRCLNPSQKLWSFFGWLLI